MLSQIRNAISTHQRKTMTVDANQAAVLVALYENSRKRVGTVFIKRVETTRHHGGQISFPGGAQHQEDRDIIMTALRETHEEIGLQPTEVEVVGVLNDVRTKTSNYVITPVVGVIPHPYPYQINVQEVQFVIEAVLQELNEKEGPRGKEYWSGDYRIWGATARILTHLLHVIS